MTNAVLVLNVCIPKIPATRERGICFEKNAPYLPTGVFWQVGMTLARIDQELGDEFDVDYIDVDWSGNAFIGISNSYSEIPSLGRMIDFVSRMLSNGWKISNHQRDRELIIGWIEQNKQNFPIDQFVSTMEQSAKE